MLSMDSFDYNKDLIRRNLCFYLENLSNAKVRALCSLAIDGSFVEIFCWIQPGRFSILAACRQPIPLPQGLVAKGEVVTWLILASQCMSLSIFSFELPKPCTSMLLDFLLRFSPPRRLWKFPRGQQNFDEKKTYVINTS